MTNFNKEFFKYSRFLFLISLIIGCISCSSNNEKTITFLHFFNSSQEQKEIEKIITDFENKNDCKINVINYDQSRGPNELISSFKDKQNSDVIAFTSEWLAQIQSLGLLFDFQLKKKFDTAFYDFLIDNCKINGKLYCLPWLVNTRFLYLNRKIMKENNIKNLPLDFRMLFDYSDKINERGKYFGIGLTGHGRQTLFKNMMPMIFTFGGNLIDSIGDITINKNNNLNGIYYYLNLSHSGLLETKREIENQFIDGKIAFCFSDLSLLQKLIEKNILNDYLIYQIPGNMNKPGISCAEAIVLGVSSKSVNKDLSLKFMGELTKWKSENNFSFNLLKYGVPAQKYFIISFVNEKVNSIIKKQINNSKLAPKHIRWYDISVIVENEIEKSIYSEKSVEGSLADAQEEIKNYLRRVRN